MGNWAELYRGICLIISHSVSLYLMSQPRPEIKHPLRQWVFSYLLMGIVVCPLLFFVGFTLFSGIVAYLLLFIGLFLTFLWLNAGSRYRSVFLFFIYVTFFMLSAAVANFLGGIFFDGSTVAIASIRTLFTITVIVVYPLKLEKPFLRATDNIDKGWGVLIAFELVSSIAISVFAFTGAFFIGNNSIYLILLMIFTIIFIASFFVVIKMVSMLNNRMSMRLIMAQQVLLENELEAEKEFVSSARRFRHDMRKHNEVVLSYLEEGKTEEAMSYLREYDGMIKSSFASGFCANSILNAILKMTERRCLVVGGRLTARVAVPEVLTISRTDMVVIFGNLLENAYEACAKTDDPWIEVNAAVKNDSLQFEIRNSMEGCLSWRDDLPLSTKNNGGTGLRNVEAVIKRCNGMMSLNQDGQVFVSRVIIPLDQKQDMP